MDTLIHCLSELNIDIDDEQVSLFNRYYDLLILRNREMNLTSVTEREDVILKHFVDSIALLKYYDPSDKDIIDVGSGAGFPGVPLGIMCRSCRIVLLDSSGKKVSFLNDLVGELGLPGVTAIHGRAEELAHDIHFRDRFDAAVSRAVSNLSTLSEYCLPFVNNNGVFISYKSGNIDDELLNAGNAVDKLNGRIGSVEKFTIPGSDYSRSFVFIDKIGNTPDMYPRRAGIPSRKPL